MRGAIVRLWLSFGAVLIAAPAISADPNASVVQVGKTSLAVGELQRRWLELPAFQRQALGKSDKERLEAYVERWIIPQMLLTEEAMGRKAPSTERRRTLEVSVLQQVMADRVRKQSDASSPVTEADIKAYLEMHREEFDRPERIMLFRILVATEGEARAVIQKLRGAPDFDAWRNLAREKSLDRATNMRGGELGFVAADGKSDIYELQVDPVLVSAAQRLNDGEIGKNPVRESDKFAVIWRRGHVAASHTNLNTLGPTIRAHLREARAAAAFNELLTQLKSKYVKEFSPNRLDGIDFGQIASDRFQSGPPVNSADASP